MSTSELPYHSVRQGQKLIRITPDKYLDFFSASALYLVYSFVSFLAFSANFITKERGVELKMAESELWKKLNVPKQAQYSYEDDCEAHTSLVVILSTELNRIVIKSDDAPIDNTN